MDLSEATRKRIKDLAKERTISITELCLISNKTPSTIFDFLNKKSKYPKIITIKKLCVGAGITLSEFYAPEYFNSTEDVYR